MTSLPPSSPLLGTVTAPAQNAGTPPGNTASTERNDAFAGLLHNDGLPVADAEAAGEELPVSGDALLETESLTEDSDAPWPPPGLALGLETLIAPQPQTVTPQALPGALGLTASALVTGTPPTSAGLQAAPALLAAVPSSSPVSLQQAPPVEGETPPLPLQAVLDEAVAEMVGRQIDGPGSSELPNTAAFASLIQSSAGLSSPTSLSSAAATAPLTPASVDIQSADAQQGISESIEWMLDQKLQSARIRISPEQLGMIEVELKLDGNRVHAHFTSAHAEVRQVLSDSLPRLREMLDEQGLQMGQTAVDSQSSQQGNNDSARPANTLTSGNSDQTLAEPPARILHRGLLDTYA